MNSEETKYISLQEATQYCNYSQEYLSLRARQGKLKSVKFGRNWVTKKEWLDEYLKEVEEYNNKKPVPLSKEFIITKEPLPEITIERAKPLSRFSLFSFTCLIVIIFVLTFCGIIFAPSYFQKIVGGPQLTAMSAQDIFKYTIDTFREYGQWLGENIRNQISNLKTAYIVFSNLIKKKPLPEEKKEGMVVVPSTEEDEKMKEKIQESFSDEVKVELKDKTWGIIRPIFKTPTAEEYLYIMVPIKN